MTDDNRHSPGFLKRLLGVVVLGCAILVGFVIGLRTGERIGTPRLLGAMQEDVSSIDTVAVVDSLSLAELPAEPDSTEVVPEPEKVAKFTKQQVAQGVEYLAANNRWNRDEMEKIPVLQGLWDAVNTYALDDIRAYNETLASTPLTAIVDGLEQRPKKGYYAAKNDHVITLSTYIKRLR